MIARKFANSEYDVLLKQLYICTQYYSYMTKAVEQYLIDKIKERKDKDAFRSFRVSAGEIDFCSNDYLGFAKDPEIHHAVNEELLHEEYIHVNGSTGARTITGTSVAIVDLERSLASFHIAPAGLIYNSGYTANIGLFAALPYRGDTVLYDELIHASIRDGLRMSRANSYSFKHNDTADLESRLKRAKGNVYVAVEAVYSMDGDTAPLRAVADLCERYHAALIVDEAHSNGIFGEVGQGKVVELGLEEKVFARVMTFGKALGCHGAIVLGSGFLKDFLINYSRAFIYTTAPSPHQVLTIKKAYDKLSKSKHNILKLSKLVSLFKLKLQDYPALMVIPSLSPIQCVVIPGNRRVKAVCKQVQLDGFDVRPIVAPTVPEGKERIRICMHSDHREEQIIGLIQSINKHLMNYEDHAS